MVDGYFMGEYITCWEHNRYDYHGYVDPNWMNDPRYIANGGQGDVCDHETDGELRDMCYFQVYFGDERWDYKCMHHNDCPKKDPVTGEGIEGCVIFQNKRITCCCQQDLCNDQWWEQYAKLAYPSNWNANMQVPLPSDDFDNSGSSNNRDSFQTQSNDFNDRNNQNFNNDFNTGNDNWNNNNWDSNWNNDWNNNKRGKHKGGKKRWRAESENSLNDDFEGQIYSEPINTAGTIINYQWMLLLMFLLTVFNTVLICKFQFCGK